MNARRNSALSEDWFTHKPADGRDTRPVSRARMSDREIRAKNLDEADVPIPVRLRTEEALKIALHSRSQKTESWHDYENNKNYYSARRPPRMGPNEAGREIAQKYLKSKDILSNSSKGDFETDDMRVARRPQTANCSASDWFYHDQNNTDTDPQQRPKVFHEGLEYALRNRGEQDLLIHDARPGTSGEVRPYACPSAESRENAHQSTCGENMAQVLGTVIPDSPPPATMGGATVKGAEGEYYRTRDREGFLKPGNEELQLPKSRLRPEAQEIMEKCSSSSAVSCLLQPSLANLGAQEHKVHHRLQSDEARQFLERQQSGVMSCFIGPEAQSTGCKYKNKILPRGLSSQEGFQTREKNLGAAAKELMTNCHLEPHAEATHKKMGVVPTASLTANLVPHNEEIIRKAPRLQGQDALEYASKQNSGFDMVSLMNYDVRS
ncbi:hypothetical protein Ciccas_005781 [Cichlidogyrus casuarinus]|uniref:Prolactin receptor n=1 Tax=Cichlidogyrus casuarinus TaxID=1844966 RepID=A0ABD2Q7N3_9PLAT